MTGPMTMTMTMTGPVTETLLDALRRTILAKSIVVWLDKDGHYSALVDELVGEGPARVGARVLAYRGSYLELMRQLATLSEGVDPSPLLVHIPGANQDTIVRTPLLELNDTGFQFRKALETLIREAAAGRVKPDEVDAFLAAGSVSLASADAWMAASMADADDSSGALLRGTDPGRLIHDLVSKGPIERELGLGQHALLWRYLATQTGLPDAWPSAEQRRWAEADPVEAKRRIADIATAWVLCVEYVHDLRRKPQATILTPASGLARPLVDACRGAAEHLRSVARSYYVALADDVEDQILIERDEGEADELGKIDTFRFEEDRLLQAALEAVQKRDWAPAAAWASQRLAGRSVWLDDEPARRKAWKLIERATQLAAAIEGSKLSFADARNLDEATRRYAEQGAAIDRMHREFEQQADRDAEQLPHREQVRGALLAARACWLGWADARALEWSKLCEQEGPLPNADLQQRNVFDKEVEPLLGERERTAFFLVDALRFEMAQQLVELIGAHAATSVRLSPRLAELPSITAVGMNALAPSVQRGRLTPLLDSARRNIEGFDAGGFVVKTRAQRETLLARRAGGPQSKWYELEELLAVADTTTVRRQIAKSRLVVVHSIQIDKGGEAGLGLKVFPSELRQIVTAWERLREAGVRQFVISSDHGFLLRQTDDPVIVHGRFKDTAPRYVLYPKLVVDSTQLGLSLRKLGYEGAEEAIQMPRGLAVFQSGRDRKFVHGGNSPQERVIPVLTIIHKQAVGSDDQRYRIELEGEVGGPTSHKLKARVVRADNQTTLALDVEPIELELRAAEGEGVVAEVFECVDATLEAGLIRARIGDTFALRFRLSSAREQRVRVELFSVSAKRQVELATSEARFISLAPSVSGAFPIVVEPAIEPTITPTITPTKGIKAIEPTESVIEPSEPVARGSVPVASEPVPASVAVSVAASSATSSSAAWLDELDDLGVRRVMAHLAEHGEVTEDDLYRLFDSDGRQVRKFARNFEKHRARAPFLVGLSHGPTGKVYRKVTDK